MFIRSHVFLIVDHCILDQGHSEGSVLQFGHHLFHCWTVCCWSNIIIILVHYPEMKYAKSLNIVVFKMTRFKSSKMTWFSHVLWKFHILWTAWPFSSKLLNSMYWIMRTHTHSLSLTHTHTHPHTRTRAYMHTHTPNTRENQHAQAQKLYFFFIYFQAWWPHHMHTTVCWQSAHTHYQVFIIVGVGVTSIKADV